MTPKLNRLLATKHAEHGGLPIRSSTFTTNGFNHRAWESTCFEATNAQLVQLLQSTKSVESKNKKISPAKAESFDNGKREYAKTIINLLNP